MSQVLPWHKEKKRRKKTQPPKKKPEPTTGFVLGIKQNKMSKMHVRVPGVCISYLNFTPKKLKPNKIC